MRNERGVWSRLAGFAKPFRKQMVGALLLLILGTSAELAGPFVAKIIIDDHILAIQKTWYRFDQEPLDQEARPVGVPLEGSYYVREDWLPLLSTTVDVNQAAIARVRTEGTAYFLLDRPLDPDRSPNFVPVGRTPEGRELLEAEGTAAIRLTAADVQSFYSRDIPPILLLVAGYAVLILISAGLNYMQLIALQTTAQRIIQRMRMKLFSHLQKLPVAYFDTTPVGQLVSRITNDTEAIRELYVSVLATFVQNGIYLLGILIALFLLQPELAVFCCLTVPLIAGLVVTYRTYSSRYYAMIRSRLSDINATINEMIQNMAIVQTFRREADVQREFAAVNDAYFRVRVKENNLESLLLRPAVDLLWKISLTIIVWYFGSRSFHSAISFGVLFAFIDYMGRFFEPINMIMNRLSQLQQAVTSAKRVFDVLDTEPVDGGEEGRLRTVPRPQGEVVFDKVSFAYQSGQYVLKNISFTAKPGQTVALVGHTGSGKSSLMNLLLGFYPVTSGRITLDGMDVREIEPRTLRRQIGLVLQDPFLFTGTVGFNIRLYNPQISDRDVQEAAKAVKAHDFISQLPLQYDEPVAERGATLSAGQRQLLSFARALASDPAILILDEATASIDSETESAIQEALRVLSHGRTTFIIAHRLSTIQHADLILVLSRGEVVERGTHAELMEHRGLYQKMYQLQQGQVSATMEVNRA